MLFKHLDHVGIAVRDLDEAIATFDRALGLKPAVVEEVVDQQVRAALIPTSIGRFELLQPTTPESVVGRFLERRGQGMHHVCFGVDDIVGACARLRQRGAELIQGKPRQGLTGLVEFVHPRSTGGVLVEVVQATRLTPASTDLRFHHVTIAVKDRDTAAKLWQERLGVPLKRRMVSEGFQMATAWLDVGDAEVEFAQQLNETGPVARAIASRGEGLHAVVLESSDPASVAERARQAGVRVLVDKGEPDNVLRALHPQDFLGTLVLLAAKGARQGGTAVAAGTMGAH